MAGTYGPFCCSKPLRILGEAGVNAGFASIGPLPANSMTILSQIGADHILVMSAEGVVLLDQLSASTSTFGYKSYSFLDSTDIRIHECSGSQANWEKPAFVSSACRLEVVESTFLGGSGNHGYCESGTNGAQGAVLGPATRAHLVHSEFRGGEGGSIPCVPPGLFCNPLSAGNGGTGIEARNAEIIASFGSGAGAIGGAEWTCASDPGEDFQVTCGSIRTDRAPTQVSGTTFCPTASVQVPSVPDPTLGRLGMATPGGTVDVIILGAPATDLNLHVGATPVVEFVPSSAIERLVSEDTTLALGAFTGGPLVQSITIPPTAIVGDVIWVQAELLGTATGTQRSNSIPLVVR